MSEDEYNKSVMDVKNLQEITVDQGNLYTNAEQMYPTCPDRLYTPTTSEERDTDDPRTPFYRVNSVSRV